MNTIFLDREHEYETQLSPTRLFSCSETERARVAAVLGRAGVTVAQLRNAVSVSIAQARREATGAARLLRALSRTTRTTDVFRGVFNVPPTFVPDWRPANARWRDLGDLVAIRLDRAAAILSGGHMHLFCWGSNAHCPECTDAATSYRACSSYRGSYRICIGQEWWQWFRQGYHGFMASTLLHEALHVYFVLEHHRAAIGRPSVNNMYCYDTLVARLHSRTPKPGDADACGLGRKP